ncbi:MAG: PEP-CTERM sorting domain-containing protein [Gammaproteobacteria bacterium]|nr:PEP-CTERM sorting domain-containing protein [Gammaproteobacteria bacterium]MBU1977884.1 PEP-CTERM sorting domain-containing protein [Gammaproteobacteria bacterium]
MNNVLTFTTAQNVVDNGTPGTSVGDLFYGILNITNIRAGGIERWDAQNVVGATPIDSFSGYYLAEVKSIYTAFPSSTPYAAAISLGPVSGGVVDPFGKFSASELAAGAMAKLFVDDGATATAFEMNGSVSDDINKATDGTPWGTLGFNDTNNYWNALVFKNGRILGLGGLDFIANATGFGLLPINDPTCPTCAPVDLYFSTVASANSVSGAWQFIGANDGTLHPVPEPSILFLAFAGLAGLFWSRNRRH